MDKAFALECSVNSLSDRLSSMRSESNAKDELVLKHTKVAEEALAGWEKTEAEAVFLKQELDEALRQRIAAEERIVDLDAALKECMKQLRVTREEQEQRIYNAVMHVGREHENQWMLLNEKFQETSQRLAKLEAENSNLSKALQNKEDLIKDLRNCKSEVEADFNALLDRLDYNEKFGLQSQRQQTKSVHMILKLEKECQRLYDLVPKQLSCPATFVKVKSEAEVLGMEPDEWNPQIADPIFKNLISHSIHESPTMKINFLIEQLCSLDKENKSLKESIRTMGAQTSLSQELEAASTFENGHAGVVSYSESWASALITELDHFTKAKWKEAPSSFGVGVAGMDLMDDFVEIEKFATLSTDMSFEGSDVSSHYRDKFLRPLKTELLVHPSQAPDKELSNSVDTNQEILSTETTIEKYPSWLQDILRLVMGQNHITQKSTDEILEQVKIALAYLCHPDPREVVHASKSLRPSIYSYDQHDCNNMCMGPLATPQMFGSFQASDVNLSSKEMNSQRLQHDVNESICKVVELIKGIDQPSSMDYSSQILLEETGAPLTYNNLSSPSGYVVRVFQWKDSELRAVLQRFVDTCNELINGKAALESFAREVSSALEWILNHCFSVQDVASMRDLVKKHFYCDKSEGESDLEDVMDCTHSDTEGVRVLKEQFFCSPSSAASIGHISVSLMKGSQLDLKEENTRLKQKLTNMDSVQKDLEERLQLTTEKIEELMIKLRESEQRGGNSRVEVESSKETKEIIEDKIENRKLLRDDLDSQLSVARKELNVACENFVSLELELENKINRCQELETTCIELQLQLDSVTRREDQRYNADQVDGQLQTDWEITAASEKLAECQETVLNLGKQLKALSSPKETTIFHNGISTSPATATRNRRCTLLDQMLYEDNAKFDELYEDKPPSITQDIVCTNNVDPPKSLAHPTDVLITRCGLNSQVKAGSGQAVAIVPSTRCSGVSLLRKIVFGRRRESSKKTLTMVE
ncbi:hypothetical protein IFM89_033634 [Coptis chinensis]|uniref:Filament-like plant protein 7 n=1 Tax=Coptis chinensis TaxID=261450 RepID=A0A835LS99_9MAGN|nr:hypothetical protein IFM89_033634 [Coptis chinensis]